MNSLKNSDHLEIMMESPEKENNKVIEELDEFA
jgi:hypothetical protein